MDTGIPTEEKSYLTPSYDLPTGEISVSGDSGLLHLADIGQAVAASQGVPDEAPAGNRTRMIGEQVGNTALRATGSALDTIDITANWLDDALGTNFDSAIDSGVEAVHGKQKGKEGGTAALADILDRIDLTGALGSKQIDTIDKLEEVFVNGGMGEIVGQAFWTGVESLAISSGEMGAIIAALPLGAAAAFQRNHIEIKKSMGIEGAGTLESRVRALGAAAAAVGGTRYAYAVARGFRNRVAKKAGEELSEKSIVRKIAGLGTGAAKISASEGIEEVVEYGIGHQGIDATAKGYRQNFIGGALGGMILGGGAQALGAAARAIPDEKNTVGADTNGLADDAGAAAIDATNNIPEAEVASEQLQTYTATIYKALHTKVGEDGELTLGTISNIESLLEAIKKADTPEEANLRMEALQGALQQKYGNGAQIIKDVVAKATPKAANVIGKGEKQTSEKPVKDKKKDKNKKIKNIPVKEPAEDDTTDVTPPLREGGGQETIRETQSEYNAQLLALLYGGKEAVLFNKGETVAEVKSWINDTVSQLDAQNAEIDDEGKVTQEALGASNKFKKLKSPGPGSGISVTKGPNGVIAYRKGLRAPGVRKNTSRSIDAAVKSALRNAKGLGRVLGYGDKADEDYSAQGEEVTVVTDKESNQLLLVIDGASPETAAAAEKMFAPVEGVTAVVSVVGREEAIAMRQQGNAFRISKNSPGVAADKLASKATVEGTGAVRAGDIPSIVEKFSAFIDEGMLGNLYTKKSQARDKATGRARLKSRTGTTTELTDAVKATMPIVNDLITYIDAWNGQIKGEPISSDLLLKAVTPLVKEIRLTKAVNAEDLYKLAKQIIEDGGVQEILADTAIPVESTVGKVKNKGSKVINTGRILATPKTIYSPSTRLKRRLRDIFGDTDEANVEKLVAYFRADTYTETNPAPTDTAKPVAVYQRGSNVTQTNTATKGAPGANIDKLRKLATALRAHADRTKLTDEEVKRDIADNARNLESDDIIRKYGSDLHKNYSYKTIGRYKDSMLAALYKLNRDFKALNLEDKKGNLPVPKVLAKHLALEEKKTRESGKRLRKDNGKMVDGVFVPKADPKNTLDWIKNLSYDVAKVRATEAAVSEQRRVGRNKLVTRNIARGLIDKANERVKNPPRARAARAAAAKKVAIERASIKRIKAKVAINKLTRATEAFRLAVSRRVDVLARFDNYEDGGLLKVTATEQTKGVVVSTIRAWRTQLMKTAVAVENLTADKESMTTAEFIASEELLRQSNIVEAGRLFIKLRAQGLEVEKAFVGINDAETNKAKAWRKAVSLETSQTFSSAFGKRKSRLAAVRIADKYLTKQEAKFRIANDNWAKIYNEWVAITTEPTPESKEAKLKLAKKLGALRKRKAELSTLRIKLINGKIKWGNKLKQAKKSLRGETKYSTDLAPHMTNVTEKQAYSYARNVIAAEHAVSRITSFTEDVSFEQKQVDAELAYYTAKVPTKNTKSVPKKSGLDINPQAPIGKTAAELGLSIGTQALAKTVESGAFPKLVKEAKNKRKQANKLEEHRLAAQVAEGILSAKAEVKSITKKAAKTVAAGVVAKKRQYTRPMLRDIADRMGIEYTKSTTHAELADLIGRAWISEYIAGQEAKAEDPKGRGRFMAAQEDMRKNPFGNYDRPDTRTYLTELTNVISGTRELDPRELTARVADAVGEDSKINVNSYTFGQLRSFIRRYVAGVPTTGLSENDKFIQAAIGDLIEATNEPGKNVSQANGLLAKQDNPNQNALSAAYAAIPKVMGEDFDTLVEEVASRVSSSTMSSQGILDTALSEVFHDEITKETPDGRIARGLRTKVSKAIKRALQGDFEPLLETALHLTNAGIDATKILNFVNIVTVVHEAKVQKNVVPVVDLVEAFNTVFDENVGEYGKIKHLIPKEAKKLDESDRGFRMQAKIFAATDRVLVAQEEEAEAVGEFTDTNLAVEQELANEYAVVNSETLETNDTTESVVQDVIESSIEDLETDEADLAASLEPGEGAIVESPLDMFGDIDEDSEGNPRLNSKLGKLLKPVKWLAPIVSASRRSVVGKLKAISKRDGATPLTMDEMLRTMYEGLHKKDPLMPLVAMLYSADIPNINIYNGVAQAKTNGITTLRIDSDGTESPVWIFPTAGKANDSLVMVAPSTRKGTDNTDRDVVNFLHEAVHNATALGIENDPVFKEEIQQLINDIKSDVFEATKENGEEKYGILGTLLNNEAILNTVNYALTDPQEFITAALVEPNFKAFLSVYTGEGVVLSKGDNIITADTFMRKVIKSILAMLKRGFNSVFKNQKDTNLENSLLAIVMIASAQRVTTAAVQQEIINSPQYATSGLGGNGNLYSIADGLRELNESGDKKAANWTKDKLKYVLGFMTTDNIVGIWGDIKSEFKETDYRGDETSKIINPTKVFRKALTKRDSYAKTFQQQNRDIVRQGRDLATKHKKQWPIFSKLVIDSTNFDIDLSRKLPAPPNGKKTQRWKRQSIAYVRLSKVWASMPTDIKKHYRAMDGFMKTHAETSRIGIIKNVTDIWKLPAATTKRLTDATTKEEFAAIIVPTVYRKKAGGFVPLKQWPAIIKAVQTINKSRNKTGFYFPLKRYGDYFASASKETKAPVYKTEDTAKKAANNWVATGDPGRTTTAVTGTNAFGWTFTMKEEAYITGTASQQTQLEKALLDLGFNQSQITVAPKAHQAKVTGISAIIGRALAGAKDEAARSAIESAIVHLLPENSAAKHLLPRKGITGASEDINRSLANYIHSASWAIAGVKYGHALRKIVQHLNFLPKSVVSGADPARAGIIGNELAKRMDQGTVDPGIFSEVTGKIGFAWFLMSLSYTLINITQTAVLTYPYLSGRYGKRAAAKALTKAYAIIGKEPLKAIAVSGAGFKHLLPGNKASNSAGLDNLDNLVPEMVRRLKAAGDVKHANLIQAMQDAALLDASFSTMLTETIRGRDSQAGSQMVDNILDFGRTMPFIGEIVNRTSSAIAAYDLAIKAGSSIQEATDIAEDTIRKTQFDYGQSNRGRYLTANPVMRALTMFKMYPIALYGFMAEHMVKVMKSQGVEKAEAKKTLTTFFGMQMLLTGTLGVAMFEPIKLVMGALLGVFGGDDDEEEGILHALKNPEIAARSFWFDMAKNMGMTEPDSVLFSRALTNGLPSLTGINIKDRIGIENMLFMISASSGSMVDDTINSMADTFIGPIFGMGNNFGRLRESLKKGVPMSKAITAVLPKGLRDISQARQYQTEGMTDARGLVLAKPEQFTPVELFFKYIGFSNNTVSDTYANKAYYKRRTNRLGQERRRITKQWRDAVASGTPAERTTVLKQRMEYNARLRPTERAQWWLDTKMMNSSVKRFNKDQFRTRNGITYRSNEVPNERTAQVLGL